MKSLLNILSKTFCFVSVVFMLWFFVSLADVVVDNTSDNPEHFDWNLFVILTEMAEEV